MWEQFLAFAERSGCRLERTGVGKTTRIVFGDQDLGYVNSTVHRRAACYGYRFWRDHPNDAAPAGAEEVFRQRYGDLPGLDWHQGSGANSHRRFLCITGPQAAERVLLRDISALTTVSAPLVESPRPPAAPVPRVSDPPLLFSLPDEVQPAEGIVEGAVRAVTVNAYERDPAARRRCIAAHGSTCCVCGFSFAARYGPVADGYIHVHHLRPLSEVGGAHVVDPVADLRPVCPNCHAVLHRRVPAYSIEEVRAFLR